MKTIYIDIYGVSWTVSFVPTNHSALARNGYYAMGTCLHKTQEIFIAYGQPQESEYNTIAHELTHAVLYQMTLDKDNYDCEDMAKFVGTYASYIVEQTKSIIEKLRGLVE